tara:strand:- start:2338 stop:2694 length:357 start_codon:yes stop_codon:yes gene_type:complete
MKKTIRIILSPEAKEVFEYLNQEAPTSKNERTILNAVNQKIELIKINVHFGDPISKAKIPPDYKTKYSVTNLFRVELPNYWRMLYTLTEGGTEVEIVAFVLDIFDHKDYNKKLNYRKN